MTVAVQALKVIQELAESDDTNLNLRNIARIAQHALATKGIEMAETKQQIITSAGKPMERAHAPAPQSLMEVIARAASDPRRGR